MSSARKMAMSMKAIRPERSLFLCRRTLPARTVRSASRKTSRKSSKMLHKSSMTYSTTRSEKCDFRIAYIFNGSKPSKMPVHPCTGQRAAEKQSLSTTCWAGSTPNLLIAVTFGDSASQARATRLDPLTLREAGAVISAICAGPDRGDHDFSGCCTVCPRLS
jgi:hypothetical protein